MHPNEIVLVQRTRPTPDNKSKTIPTYLLSKLEKDAVKRGPEYITALKDQIARQVVLVQS